MGRCELHKTRGIVAALLTAPATFCYALSSSHVNNNMPLIFPSLGIEQSTASWIINIELLVVIITATMTGKFGERIGSGAVMALGAGIFSIFNFMYLIPFAEHSFIMVMFLRVFASIGLGLLLPSSTPMATELVVPGKLPIAVAMISVMAPIGGIASALIAGVIAKASSWRYMFVLTGAVSFIYFLAMLWKLPFKVPTRKSKIDFIGVLILAVGLTAFLLGIVGLSEKAFPQWLCYVLIPVSIVIIGFFVYYNLKLSKCPIFAPELFNKSTLLCEFMLIFNNVIQYCERYYIPFVQMILHGMDAAKSGMVLAIVGLGCIVFSPLSNIMFKRMSTRLTVIMSMGTYACLILLNSFHVRYFYNVGLYTVINFVCIGIFVMMTVNVTNYNFQSTPMKYAQTLGVMNQIMTNAGHSLGVSLAVVMNKFGLGNDPSPLTYDSVQYVYIFSAVLAFIVVAVAFAMGTFAFERGKVGFKETNLQRTKTFEENLVGDGEMVVTENLEENAQLSKVEKILTLFNGL